MILDTLYELAFAYKKTKLWKSIWDSEVFAVRLSDGKIGYISIMGAGGEYCALGLYIGEKGFDSFRTVITADEFMMSPFKYHETLMQQECLQCVFDNKDELSEEEQEEVKKYARAHGIRLAGRNAYPQFVKYQPNHYPWRLQTEQEQAYLCEALEAAIELARLLEGKIPGDLGVREINDKTRIIPMLEKNGAYTLSTTELPKETAAEYPVPEISNDVGIAKLKKAKRMGVWECEIIRVPEPVQSGQDEVPVFPVLFLALENETDYILPVPPVADYEENPKELLDLFIEALLMQKICPEELLVRDERTYTFAEGLAKKLGIKINICRELPSLDEAEYVFWEQFGADEEEEMEDMLALLDSILELDEEQLRSLPDVMAGQLEILINQHVLPPDMERKLEKVLHLEAKDSVKAKIIPVKEEGVTSEQSYVISVSLYTGCYRHIQIPGSSTLWDLHSAILDAFQFDDDHAHAFFMDNINWSARDCYFAAGVDDSDRMTDDYRLRELGLYKGKQFKYIFDFGDEWTFQCKVLRLLDKKTDVPIIIRSKGEAPKQYEGWDE